MKGFKKFQLFVNSHYELIKVVLLIINLGLIGFLIISSFNTVLDGERYRNEQTEKIIRESRDRTDEVMKALEENNVSRTRQFQAMCLILIEVAGEEALNKLDPPFDERCRNLAQEPKANTPTSAVAPQPIYSQPAPIVSDTPAENTPAPQATPQPEAPNQPGPQSLEGIFSRLKNILRIGG